MVNRVIGALALLCFLIAGSNQGHQVWQADIRIRTLEVTRAQTHLIARVVVYTENDDDARDARLLILLPIGVGIERLAAGCVATSGPSMVPSLRAAVTCELGTIPNRGFKEVLMTTTVPADGAPRRLGAFTYSSTPDPVPSNNYAERVLP